MIGPRHLPTCHPLTERKRLTEANVKIYYRITQESVEVVTTITLPAQVRREVPHLPSTLTHASPVYSVDEALRKIRRLEKIRTARRAE